MPKDIVNSQPRTADETDLAAAPNTLMNSTEPPPAPRYSPQRAAELLSLKEVVVLELVRSGRLGGIWFQGELHIPVDAIWAFLSPEARIRS